jgi:hypothetical protein
LASLPLFASAAPVNALEILPDGTMLERSIEEREAYAGRPNGTSQWVTQRSWEEYENGELVRRAGTSYTLDCKDYPEVSQLNESLIHLTNVGNNHSRTFSRSAPTSATTSTAKRDR